MDIHDILERAADLIEPEGAWTQGDTARDENGVALGIGTEPQAVCWCILGAIAKVSGMGWSDASQFIAKMYPDDPGADIPGVASWNDAPERTQVEVVAKLREAAAIARAGGVS